MLQSGAGYAQTGFEAARNGANSAAGHMKDMASIGGLDEARNFFNADFNNYLAMGFDSFGSIIPIDYYGSVTKLLLRFFLLLPFFFCFYTLKMFHDSIYTMVVLSVFVFAMLTYIHYKLIDEKIWLFIALKNFNHDYKKRMNAAMVAGLAIGVALGVALILYFKYVAFGPTEIVLQMPYFANYFDLLYWTIFTIFFVVVVPVTEVLFFFIFQGSVWFTKAAKFQILIFYTLYHFGWICEVVGNWYSIAVITVLAFGLGLLLTSLLQNEDVFKCIFYRVGVSLGVWMLLVALWWANGDKKWALPTQRFARGSANNMFMRK